MASFSIMNDLGAISIFDVTHSLQLPGGLGKVSGGKREFVIPLARASVAAFAKGLFMEVHDNPAAAKSDAATVLSLESFKDLLDATLPLCNDGFNV
jgi:2-dehydro-3-deoxyphosphooctonate aldolase (KDO 8-P synthase)